MWLFPLHSALFFVWGNSFRNTCRRDWKDRGWKERTPGELYITGSDGIQTNQKGRRGLLLWSWQLCSLKWEMMLQPDGVRLDTGDTQTHMQVCRCAYMCRETHTHTHTHIEIILPFLSLADTLEKAQPEREGAETMSWFCQPQCVYPCIHVCICCMCVCVCQGMGFLCHWLRTRCHNICWSRSITENSFPSCFTVFDGSASSRVTLQSVIWKAERVVCCWLPSIKEHAWNGKKEKRMAASLQLDGMKSHLHSVELLHGLLSFKRPYFKQAKAYTRLFTWTLDIIQDYFKFS